MLTTKISSLNIISQPENTNLLSDIEFELLPNNIYTILGENGCGKTTLLLSVVNLLDKNDFNIDGTIKFKGENLLELSESEFNSIRKENFRYVFQDAIATLDPLKRIKYYFELSSFPLSDIEEELKYFQLPDYSILSKLYPHQLSTGMAQRIIIVLALLANPSVMLMDEPTSALDLPIINLLLARLKKYTQQKDKVLLLITQDLPFAKEISDYIALMKNGKLTQFETPDTFFNKED